LLGALAVATFLPPFAAFVLVKAGGQERGAGQPVDFLGQGSHFGVDGGQLLFFLAQVQGVQPAFLSVQGVHLGH
jgi:hypothetical protein